MADDANDPTNADGHVPPVDSAPAGSQPSEAAEQAALNDPVLAAENEARRMGWVDKHEFRGDPARWVPAERFLQRGREELPILRERFRSLDQQSEVQRRELIEVQRRLQDQTRVLEEFRDHAAASEQRAYARARRELEGKMSNAVANADVGAFNEAKAELDALAPQPQQRAPQQPQMQQPVLDAGTAAEIKNWVSENTWFHTDPQLYASATELYGAIERAKPHLTTRQKLAEVRRAVAALNTDHPAFANPRRSAPAAVSTPQGAPGGKKNGKSYEDLPADARAACDRFVRTIPNYTKEQYVAQYFSGE